MLSTHVRGHVDLYPNAGLPRQPEAFSNLQQSLRAAQIPKNIFNNVKLWLSGHPKHRTERGTLYVYTNCSSPYALGLFYYKYIVRTHILIVS